MESLTTIVAKSHAQAMEWSLVLASQGIETSIQKSETSQWLLIIPGSDAPKAFESLRLYRKENRPVQWEQPVPGTHLFFHWGAFGWTIWMLAAYALLHSETLMKKGRMDSVAVLQGEWWRLFTAVSLHADEAHLASNLIFGTLLLGLAMALYGPWGALLAGFVAGALGNVAAMAIHGADHLSLGASGMVMGALGLLSVYFITMGRFSGQRHFLRRSLIAGFLLLTLLGMNPETDVIAHVGGFVGGCFAGTVLTPTHGRHFDRLNAASAATYILLNVLVWYLALR